MRGSGEILECSRKFDFFSGALECSRIFGDVF